MEHRVRKNIKLSLQGYITYISYEKHFINLHITNIAEANKLEKHLPKNHLFKYKRDGNYVLPIKFKQHHNFNDDNCAQEIKANINFLCKDDYCVHVLSDFKILTPCINN